MAYYLWSPVLRDSGDDLVLEAAVAGGAKCILDEFDWSSAWQVEDTRKDYDERRYRALGYIGTRLHALVYTPRLEATHVVSLRKANRREEKMYAAQAKS